MREPLPDNGKTVLLAGGARLPPELVALAIRTMCRGCVTVTYTPTPSTSSTSVATPSTLAVPAEVTAGPGSASSRNADGASRSASSAGASSSARSTPNSSGPIFTQSAAYRSISLAGALWVSQNALSALTNARSSEINNCTWLTGPVSVPMMAPSLLTRASTVHRAPPLSCRLPR